jgi:hypothetical protein
MLIFTKNSVRKEIKRILISEAYISNYEEELQKNLVSLTGWDTIQVYFEILDQIVNSNIVKGPRDAHSYTPPDKDFKAVVAGFKALIKEGEYESAFVLLSKGIEDIPNCEHEKTVKKALGIVYDVYQKALFKNKVWLVMHVASMAVSGYLSYLYIFNPKLFNGGLETIKTWMNKIPFPMETIGAWINKTPIPTAIIKTTNFAQENIDAFGHYVGWKQTKIVFLKSGEIVTNVASTAAHVADSHKPYRVSNLQKVATLSVDGCIGEYTSESLLPSVSHESLWSDAVKNAGGFIASAVGLGSIKGLWDDVLYAHKEYLCAQKVSEFNNALKMKSS